LPEWKEYGMKDADMQRIEEVIMENIFDPRFGVAQLAQILGISATKLREKFNRQHSEGPRRYMEKIRLQKAVKLLQAGKSVNITYTAAGFGTSRGFRYAFKRSYNACPSEVRKNRE